MASIEINLIDLDTAAQSIPTKTPVTMINLIKFKPQTTYPSGSPFTQLSGEEAYVTRYGAAFRKVAASLSPDPANPPYKPLWLGKPQVNLVAPPHAGDQAWDLVGVIWYRDFDAFRLWVDSKEYEAEALPHRLASVLEYRLYATVEINVGGN